MPEAAGWRAADWRVEAERPAVVRFGARAIDVDTPAGLTLWYRPPIAGPVVIRFEAMAVSAGGPNDRVSDVNAFWMAREPDGRVPMVRSGAFADYDTLRLYYVGIGGNANGSTRMRRYVGQAGVRPLLPQHDRNDAASLLVPNRWTRIRLVADGGRIAVWRDGRRLFAMDDPAPYTSGWFGLRTTQSHIRFRKIRITTP
ncbi:DUF6250 domain-containing protein [Sphingomonas montana]|uniref:DUF6250 domain-containing protein n=1 Tax=Sphingomonas montana TaxID=1843236 RepID=UPI001F0A8EC7|nr:DUF6250 domain-containing protein [Sphingomonas montana]